MAEALDILETFTNEQIVRAAHLLGQRLLCEAKVHGDILTDVNAEIDCISKKLSTLSYDGKALTDEFAPTFKLAIAEALNNEDLQPYAKKAVSIAENPIGSVGWGAEVSGIIVAIGFSISLVLIVSGTRFKGKIGAIQIEKQIGFPKEIVEIVKNLSTLASAGISESGSTMPEAKADVQKEKKR